MIGHYPLDVWQQLVDSGVFEMLGYGAIRILEITDNVNLDTNNEFPLLVRTGAKVNFLIYWLINLFHMCIESSIRRIMAYLLLPAQQFELPPSHIVGTAYGVSLDHRPQQRIVGAKDGTGIPPG